MKLTLLLLYEQSAEVPVKFGIISKEKILQSSSGISNPSSAATETSADAATMQVSPLSTPRLN